VRIQPLRQQVPNTPPRGKSGCYVCGRFGCHTIVHDDDGFETDGEDRGFPPLCTSLYDCPSWTAVGKRPPEPEYGHPGSAESVVPDLSQDPVANTTSTSVYPSVNFAESPAAMFSLFIPFDFVDYSPPANVCILRLPARIPEDKAPRVMASIDGVVFPLLLDTGGEVSVLPMDLFRSFNRLLEVAVNSRTVATFGNGAVQLFEPVELNITFCGVSLEHPFYLVDDKAASLSPALGGYDLMKAAHLVMDIPTGLAWSRLTQPLLEPQTPNPNPSIVELPHTHFNSSVLLVEGSHPSLVSVAEENRDCSVCEDVAVLTSSLVESVSLP